MESLLYFPKSHVILTSCQQPDGLNYWTDYAHLCVRLSPGPAAKGRLPHGLRPDIICILVIICIIIIIYCIIYILLFYYRPNWLFPMHTSRK